LLDSISCDSYSKSLSRLSDVVGGY
jgi:hypothetical protein